MDTEAPPSHRAGITGTGIRFALLMTVVTAASVSMLDTALAPAPNDTPGDGLGCLLAAGIDPDGSNLQNRLVGSRSPGALRECLAGVPTVEDWKGMVATLVLLAVAALTYWWLPRWRDRWRRTLPVETVDPDGGLAAELAELRDLAGTGHRVGFRVDPERTSAGAVVYGRLGRYTVCLHAGLLAQRGSDRDGFRAVVLHELAHVRNRDVDFAYSSTALWRAFVLLALLPYLYEEGSNLVIGLLGLTDSPFWPGAGSIIAYSLLSGLLLVALVHLTRADLLRRRELHADALAVSWGANPAAWRHPDTSARMAALLRRGTMLLRTHPDWVERRGVLADPARLFGVGALQMFLTGVAGTLLLNELSVLPAVSGGMETAWLTAAFVGSLLVLVLRRSVLGTGRAEGTHRESGAAPGLWLGCGLMVGEFVRGGNNGNEWLIAEPWYMLLFLAVGAVPAAWSAQSMRLELAVERTGLRRTAALLNGVVTVVLLWGGLRWWQQWGKFQAMGMTGSTQAFRTQITNSFPGPWHDYGWELSAGAGSFLPLLSLNEMVLLSAAAAAMVLLPLLLHFCAGRSTLRVGRTLCSGLAGGVLCLAAFAAGSFGLHQERPAAAAQRYTAAFQYVQVLWLLIILTAACLLTAAVVAALSRRHWMLRGLLAAQVVQLVGYAAVFPLFSADGCLGPVNAIAIRCHWLPAKGWFLTRLIIAQSLTTTVVFSGCAALAGAGVARVVRRYRSGSAPPRTDPAPPVPRVSPSRLKRTSVLALCLPVLVLTVFAHTDEAGPPQSKAASLSTQRTFAELIDTPTTARAAKIRQWQALAWLTKGGLTRVKRIDDAYLALAHAVTDMAGQKPGADGKVKLDNKQLSRLCGTLHNRAKQANSYFPVPDKDLQKKWSHTLRELVGSSKECLFAMGESKESKQQSDAQRERRLKRFLQASPQSMRELSHILDDMARVAKHPPQGR